MLQLSDSFCGPPLDLFQHIHVFSVLTEIYKVDLEADGFIFMSSIQKFQVAGDSSLVGVTVLVR